MTPTPCSVDGCENDPLTRGLCAAHYARLKRYGDPTYSPGPSGKKPTPIAERFWPKVDKSGGPDACWPWAGHVKRNGYGAIGSSGKHGKVSMAHRVAYELAHGPIAAGLEIDHLCHNRACVNVLHLRAVPGLVNNHNRKGANRGSISGVRNVNWYKPYGKWMVRFTYAGQRYSRGYFDTIEEAERHAVLLREQVMRGEPIRPRRRGPRKRGPAEEEAA